MTCLKYEYKRIGFKIAQNDDTSTKIWKSNMLDFLCHVGDEDCIKEATKEYKAVKGDLSRCVSGFYTRIIPESLNNFNYYDRFRVDPNLQSVVLCTMLRGEDSENIRVALKERIIKIGPSVRSRINLLHTVTETMGCEYLPYDSTM